MKHGVDGRKLGRNTPHRIAMFRNMANAVIIQEQIVTTLNKAREVKRVVDRLITLGKKDSLHHKRLAFDRTRDRDVVQKLFDTLQTRYKKRPGGYTRVVKVSDRRRGDAAEMAILELVDAEITRTKKPEKSAKDAAKDAKKEGAEEATAAVKDPFSGFRRMFGKGKEKATREATTKKSSAPRKEKKV